MFTHASKSTAATMAARTQIARSYVSPLSGTPLSGGCHMQAFGGNDLLPVLRPLRPTRIQIVIAEQDGHERLHGAIVGNAWLEASENLNPTRAAIGEGRWTRKLDQLGQPC